MTVNDCIKLVDAMTPNCLDASVKLRFLKEIEGQVQVELLGQEPGSTLSLDDGRHGDTELIAPHPFDRLYLLYVTAMMDYLNGDVSRFENGAALFNRVYQSYGKWLRRRGD